MDKREQQILDQIREQAEEVAIPETLRPEAIRKRLEEDPDGKIRKRYRRRIYRAGSVAAACLVVAAGMLVWGVRENRTSTGQTSQEERITDTGQIIRTAENYEEIYAYLETDLQIIEDTEQIQSRSDSMIEKGTVTSESAADSGAAGQSAVSGTGTASDYSQTNVRQEGVDEGDIVKTDGKYLYVRQDDGHTVALVDTQDGRLEQTGEIGLEQDEYVCEFYVTDQKLILIVSGQEEVSAVTYDIQDPTAPEIVGEVTQSGDYQSSRMADGYLYLFTQYYVDLWNSLDVQRPYTYLPIVNGNVMKETDICLPQTNRASMYEVITSIDPEEPDQVKDSKALLSKGGELYVSNENIYYYETLWKTSSDIVTSIRKIAYSDGKIQAAAQGSFDGYLNDSFSIDEYDGYLRVVTTVDDTNSVYVLDKKLEEVGAIEGLAKDERIYSARFMGETAYFVTFKETDPLFSVDLSDPEHPTILGALKIPGFSEYLHYYGQNRLLGIGMNVDEETQITEGLKLTMFDISDPEDVKETDTYILDTMYYTDLFDDYKAVLIDPEKNLIGFSAYGEGGQVYFLFDYDEAGGFRLQMEEEVNGNNTQSTRGVNIGEILYVVQGNVIEAYTLEDYRKVGDLIL